MKYYKYILITSLLTLLYSCSDFLKEEDKDQLIPRTTSQYAAMLHQKGFIDVSWNYTTDIMTDDIEENYKATTSAKNAFKSLYTWQRDVEYDGKGEKTSKTNPWWGKLYNNILVGNYILENVDNAEGTDSEKNYIKGESAFLRARAYLELACIYAPAYNDETASTTIGVPIRLDTGVKNSYSRNSLKEVYDRIEQDLLDAIDYFSRSSEKKSIWHPNTKSAQLLLSRLYLYKGEWDNVISVTSNIINNSSAGLRDLKTFINVPFVTNDNSEIFHSYGDCFILIIENDGSNTWQNDIPAVYGGEDDNGVKMVSYKLSSEVINSLWPGDCRKSKFIVATSDGVDVPAKWHSQFTSTGAYNYRLSEAYLNRAEAYAAKNLYKESMNDVKEVIAHRVKDMNAINIDVQDKDVRKFVLDERRREFFGENHRWYDLKRTASWYPKQINHQFTLRSNSSSNTTGIVQGSELYLLAPNDPNFTFEIPEEETTINTVIERYGARIDKVAIKQN